MAPQSSVAPVFRVAFFLGCGAGALAERATSPVDDGMALLQITRQLSPEVFQVDKACVTPLVNFGSSCPGGESGEITICDGVTTVPYGAFYDCHHVTKVTLPGSLTTIESYTFTLCDLLAEVTFPHSLVAIGAHAFLNTALAGDVYIPVPSGSVTIGVLAFPSGVTLRYLEIPTPSPTAPPTAPTPVPTHGASATGDPHVTNVDGVRFDIFTVGSHELLRLPRRANLTRGSVEKEPLLSVIAGVERANENECHELFVKQVDVTGGWLNSSGPLRFRADGGSLNAAQAIVLSINGSQVDAQELGRDSRIQPFLEVIQPSSSRANQSFTTMKKVPMLTVKLSFAAATLKIVWVHRAVPNEPSLNHLNFQASGLHRFLDGAGMDVGGILGRDDHSDAASLPAECKRAGADLRASGRALGEEDDPQVIAAMW